MTKTELQALLTTLPSDIDAVVGNSDIGIYYEPTLKPGATVRLWKLVQENPLDGPDYVTYFETKTEGERAQTESALKSLMFQEVDCVRF